MQNKTHQKCEHKKKFCLKTNKTFQTFCKLANETSFSNSYRHFSYWEKNELTQKLTINF